MTKFSSKILPKYELLWNKLACISSVQECHRVHHSALLTLSKSPVISSSQNGRTPLNLWLLSLQIMNIHISNTTTAFYKCMSPTEEVAVDFYWGHTQFKSWPIILISKHINEWDLVNYPHCKYIGHTCCVASRVKKLMMVRP